VILSKSAAQDSPLDVTVKTMRARIAMKRGRYAEARALLDAALERGKDGYLAATSVLARAELNLHENQLAAAEADARRALTFAQTTQGDLPFSSRTGTAWLMLGRVLARRERAADANSAFQAAIMNLSNTVDAGHPLLLMARDMAAGPSTSQVARR
jgi:tetratricopeptide (TPR) repeat protein